MANEQGLRKQLLVAAVTGLIAAAVSTFTTWMLVSSSDADRAASVAQADRTTRDSVYSAYLVAVTSTVDQQRYGPSVADVPTPQDWARSIELYSEYQAAYGRLLAVSSPKVRDYAVELHRVVPDPADGTSYQSGLVAEPDGSHPTPTAWVSWATVDGEAIDMLMGGITAAMCADLVNDSASCALP